MWQLFIAFRNQLQFQQSVRELSTVPVGVPMSQSGGMHAPRHMHTNALNSTAHALAD
jgi:hypothetical protein